MSEYTNLTLEKLGHTALIVMTNQPAHTWTEASLESLRQLVSDLEADSNIYALVITGEGPKFFSAGADLKLFVDGDKARARDVGRRFGQAFEALSAFRGVSIAAINGYAMGGGLECALACDIRIAEEHAQMALPEAGVGLLPCAGGTQNLPWLVGEGWAKRMILCGERVNASTARSIGLVEEVVPTGCAREAALKLAERVAAQSPSTVTHKYHGIIRGTSQPSSMPWRTLRSSRSTWSTREREEEWLLIEWPQEQGEPLKYWLSSLSEKTSMRALVHTAKARWLIERDYQELKQEFGLGHYEGRGWRGFHHHASLCIAAYGFLLDQRLKSGGSKKNSTGPEAFGLPEGYKPRGSRQDAAPRTGLHRDASIPVRTRNRPAPRSLPVLREAT